MNVSLILYSAVIFNSKLVYWLSFVLRNHPSMSLKACEHPNRVRFPAHPKFLKK